MIDKVSNKDKINAKEWLAHIEAWEKSGKTQPQFCQEHGLTYSTFGYWRTCYLNQRAKSKALDDIHQPTPVIKNKPAFIPVRLPEVKPVLTDLIQARFATGLALALPLSMPVNDMALLLRMLEQQHAN